MKNDAVAGRTTCLAVFVGVFAIALAFAAFTNHAWEDYYITYRASKNLATGHGLVFTIGERVHAYTSPINVLVPAILSYVTGNKSDDLVLWLFRVISCFALAAAAVLLLRIALARSLAAIPVAVLIGMFATDAKIVDFSINGQEIAFMMLFLALALHALLVPSRSASAKLGLAWAGLMWTRPDGFIYAAAICLGVLIFNAGDAVAKSRLGLLGLFVRAGLLTTVLYLPWFLWAWHYYGSPVPHPVAAKGLDPFVSPWVLLRNFVGFPLWTLGRKSTLVYTFMPAYQDMGGWHWATYVCSQCIAWVSAFYWCLPFGRPKARAVSFAFMSGHFYLTFVAPHVYPWYIANCTLLGIVAFSFLLQDGLTFASLLKEKMLDEKGFWQVTVFIRSVAAVAIAMSVLLFLCVAYQMRIQQSEIELGIRKQIGLWLRDNAHSTKDTVFLEPLGYIGYYSQLKMLDYPGLSSPEVVSARRNLNSNSWAKIIPYLRPDWLVLRPEEESKIQNQDPSVLPGLYERVKTFAAADRVKSYRWLPGRPYLEYDQTFTVYKLRKDGS